MKIFILFFFLLSSVLFAPASFAQNHITDSLLHQLTLVKDTTKVNLLNQISKQFGFEDPAKAIEYAEQALQLAQQLNFSKGIADAYNRLGGGYYYQNNYQQALEWHTKELEFNRSLGSVKGERLALINLGMIYHKQNNYPKALEFYFKSLRISEQQRDDKLIASSLNNIADVYTEQQNYDKALDYYQEALKIRKKIFKEGRKVSQVLNNIGGIYLKRQQFQQALPYFQSSLQGLTEQDQDMKAIILTNIGMIYGGIKEGGLRDYPKALQYLTESLQLEETIGDTYYIPYTIISLAYVYEQTGRLKESEKHAQRALQMAQAMEIKSLMAELYLLLSQLAEKQGNYPRAYQYHKSFVDAEKSVSNEESTRKIAQLQANYEIDKKQVEIELLKKDGELLKKDTEKATLLRNTIAVGLVATLFIAGLLLSRQRLIIRQNRLLLEKSTEVAQKNHQLEQQASVLEKQAVELAGQAQKLKELDQVKSNFFANISHEFRTPLTLILSGLNDKLIGIKAHKAEEFIHVNRSEISIMHRNAKRLLQLINQLLDLSKVESGKMQLELAKGDMAHFFRILAGSFSSLADHRKISFELKLAYQSLPALFDADKMEKIFSNLLSNAFKFTADGGKILLQVYMHEQTDGNSELEVIVEDNGAGIPAEGLDKVFERFYQGNTYYSDGQGTGIGLALTKELVELHGGSIRVESERGKGARFIVNLPFVAAADQIKTGDFSENQIEIAEESSLINFAPESKELLTLPDGFSLLEQEGQLGNPSAINLPQELPLVLIVEDNEDLRTYIRSKLAASYRIIESENGLKGVENATASMPDLIISDWMMPDMDGLQLCSKIKSDERTSHIPVILLTALATAESKITGLQKGADEYLTKPFDARELEIRVKNLIENRRKLRDRYSKQILLQPMDIEVTSTDEKFLQRVMQIVEQKMGETEFTAEAFSREVGMSRMQLHRKLTALTGQSTTDFLRTLRLKRAVQLMEAHMGNISEIAYEVGFNNLSYFAKCFREQYGMSPNEYVAKYEAAS